LLVLARDIVIREGLTQPLAQFHRQLCERFVRALGPSF
jgi:hypothetical protein